MEIIICGYKVLIDEEDYDIIRQKRWYVTEWEKGYIYFAATINKRRECLHRYIMNCQKGLLVDHINGDVFDNRKSNLRICTKAENSRNQKKHKNNKTGYKGVFYDTARKKYTACIKVMNKTIFLGRYNTPEVAYKIYCDASVKYHGEFSRV